MPADRLIQDEFEGYIKSVYDGLAPGSDQYEHLRGAFFGGAMIAMNKCLWEIDYDVVKSMQREQREFLTNAPIATRPIAGDAYSFWLGDPKPTKAS